MIQIIMAGPYHHSLKSVLLFILMIKGCTSQSNKPPVFAPSPSAFEIEENTPPGTVLTTLRATDPEGNRITFSIEPPDFFSLQTVNPNEVKVIHKAEIDYEKNSEVRFTVTAKDDVSNSRTNKLIVVTVTDLNDNKPEFVGTRFFTMSEDTEVGYTIRNAFLVTDKDTSGRNAELTVTCFVDSNNTQAEPLTREACDTFSLNTTRVSTGNYSVHITLKKELDFEKTKSYIMAVKVEDGAPPKNSDLRNVVITVLDAQDQKPVFIGAPFSFFPFEERPVGSVIDKIEVYDGDRSAQPARNLKLELLNDTRGWLELSALTNNSGIFSSNLTVKSRMDREAFVNSSIYTVGLRLSELKQDGSVDASAVVTSHININLLDINDNGPEFYTGQNRTAVTEPLVLSIEEGLGVNTPLPGFLLSILDADSVVNQFTIRMEGVGNDTFQLSPTVGTSSAVLSLSVKKEANIDYEKEEFRHMELRIIATERSEEAKYSNSATVIINLKDKNDNSPLFSEAIYFATISPDNKKGDRVIDADAVDADSGSFGNISFSLGQASDLVSIDSRTGVVSLIKEVPQGMDSVEIELVATDGGGRSSTATLKLTVRDEFPEAPQFDSHIYNATVIENRDVFQEAVTVHASYVSEATDTDSTAIRYRIIAGNTPDNAFRLHEVVGSLTLTRRLQKSDGRQFNLTVEASDGDLTDTAYVIVDLLDSNDYTPAFTANDYSKTISELTPVGTVLFNITATDADGKDEAGGRVTYSILSGDSSQRFSIDPGTGVLSVNAELDYDIQPSFTLQVKAEDQGVPVRSAIAYVYITLTDANNKLPKFQSDLYVQYMNEDDPVGTRVIQLTAYDLDKTAALRYSISNDSYQARDPYNRDVLASSGYDFRNGFKIDEKTGVITTTLPFNRDAVSYVSFRVVATDINGDKPAVQRGFTEVQVHIRKQGVGVPEFLNKPWTPEDKTIIVNVTEGTAGHILTLIARDSITHEPITNFREVIGDTDNIFTVNADGTVYLTKALDYEQLIDKSKRIVIEAITPEGERSTATLVVNVINVNDNSPQFSQTEYKYSASEGNYTRDFRLGSVSVTDKDGDVNFRYKITGRYSQYFYIDNRGNVFIRNNTVIDAETISRYNLYIEVTDRNVSGRTSTVPLTIDVDNRNEHSPICIQSPVTFFIPQSASVYDTVGQVIAIDNDVGDSVEYLLEFDQRFIINRTTGVISVAAPLRSSAGQVISLDIQARDSGDLSTVCQVRIVVTTSDSSNLPIFVQPPNENTTYQISEGSSVNTTITRIEATTTDQRPLTNVQYILSNYTTQPYFRINPDTGRLYVHKEPDREDQQLYELIVTAKTNTTEISRKFYINVTDVDDNKPRFDNCSDLSYPLKIDVEKRVTDGDRVIGRINACDDDEYPYNVVYYYRVECNDGSTTTDSRIFSVNKVNGEITVNSKTLDNSDLSSHTFCINASSSPIDASMNSAQWKVVVNVKNSYEVTFLQSNVSTVMSGNTSIGQEVLQVSADVGSVPGIQFKILNVQYIKGSTYIQGGNNSTIASAFIIDPYTGKVTTNLPSYIGYVGGIFVIKIEARTATSSATLELRVFINNPSEQLIVVFDREPKVVRDFMDDFLKQLAERNAQYTFKVQKITYHVDPDNQQTVLDKTDVYMYVLDKDGNIVATDKVAEMLNAAYADDAFAKKYGLSGDGPRTSRLVTPYGVEYNYYDWYGYEWIWWVIIACAVVLIIDALILIGCLLYLYNMYIYKPRQFPVYYTH